jgi:hypothetical protein
MGTRTELLRPHHGTLQPIRSLRMGAARAGRAGCFRNRSQPLTAIQMIVASRPR